MNYWLVKTEPSVYSWDDLRKAKSAVWDGVKNPVALKNLRAARRGDPVLIYHTGAEKRVVGIAEVSREAYPDPKKLDERLLVVDLVAREKLETPVPLQILRKEAAFADSPLLCIGRLSVVPLDERQWKTVLKLAAG